jgi:rRNA maturation RNase YbeY
MSAKSKVQFFFEVPANLKQRGLVKSFIESLFKKENKDLDRLVYVFTTDKKLLNLNKEYLNHDYYTDILTFDLSEDSKIKGEIYISVDRVRENALSLRVTLKNELLRVILHGALHLCGYTDKTSEQERKIRSREEYYLDMFHVK